MSDASQQPAEQKQNKRIHWWHRPMGLIVLFCCVGPLMLPLVWWNPVLSRRGKIIWTLGILGLSWFLISWTAQAWRSLQSTFEQLQAM